MRKDWVVKKLGDICLSKSAIKRAKDVYSGDSEISYIDISSIDNHRNLICNINTLRFQNAPSRAQQCVEKNDILVSLVRPNLKNIAQIDFDHNSMVASSGFCVLRVKDDIINSYFLRYYLLSDSFVIYLMNNINGINYPAVKEIDVKSYVLKIPPLQTQQQIVEELDCLTSIIEKQKKQLEELDNLAQSIFYDMFGDPIENEKGWNIEQLGNICDVRDGTHDSPKYLNYSDYVLITSKNITNGDLDFSHANYISKEDYEKINLRSKVDEGDILMAMIGTIGKPIIVKK
jgi:type I restriction enzyme S subunit